MSEEQSDTYFFEDIMHKSFCFFYKIIFILLVNSTISTPLFSATNLIDLSSGKASLGGKILLNLKIDEGGNTSLDFELRPELAYFVVDDAEIFLNLKLSFNLLNTGHTGLTEKVITWGSSVGPRYYFLNSSRLRPYLGASYGFELNNFRMNSFLFDYSLMTGMLYGMDDSFALDFAMPVSVHFSHGHIFKGITVVPGLWGVKTIF